MSERFTYQLGGPYNTRVTATNVLIDNTYGIVGVGVVGLSIVGKLAPSTTKDRRLINCFPTKIEDKRYLVKRPGFASSLTPQASSIGNSILVWTGNGSKIISAFGATNSSIYDSTTRLVTNNADTTIITGKARSITETVVGTTATLTIASTDSTAWYYQPAGTVTKISDAQYPGNNSLTTVGGFAHMDGWSFIMDSTGVIWNSENASITSWLATGFVTANSYPDAGIGVIRLGDKIMAFGTESVQFFYNSGLTPAPLIRVEPMTLRIGCVSADAIAEIGNVVFWAGSSPQGGLGIHSYSNGYKRISTPEIETILILAGAANISLAADIWYGRHILIVSASTISFGYCLEEDQWFEINGTVNLWYKASGVSAGSTQVSYWISKTSTSGKVFVINPASLVFQDNGVGYAATYQSSRVGENNQRTFWEEVEIVADTETSGSDLTLSSYDDDYTTPVVLGVFDLSSTRPRLSRCGSSFRRAYVLSHSFNGPMRLEKLIGRKSMAA